MYFSFILLKNKPNFKELTSITTSRNYAGISESSAESNPSLKFKDQWSTIPKRTSVPLEVIQFFTPSKLELDPKS